MSFSTLVSHVASRLVSTKKADPNARRAALFANPWTSWSERRKERALAESDRRFAMGATGGDESIILKYQRAAHRLMMDELATLLRHEARVGSRSGGPESALVALCLRDYDWKRNIPAVEFMAHQCELNAPLAGDLGGPTLFMAICKKNAEAAKVIFKYNLIDLDRADGQGRTPLSVMASVNHPDTLDMARTIATPERARRADQEGFTPLMRAAESGSAAMAEMLAPISDVDACCAYGSTALMRAAGRGQIGIVQILAPLSTIHATNQDGDTALMIAQSHGHHDIVAMLERMEMEETDYPAASRGKRQRL